jgi:class 3 adenylate cyclase
MLCTGCEHRNEDGARFCARCGRGLGRACAACGRAATEDARFCIACGARLGEPVEAAANEGSRAVEPAPRGERRQVSVVFADLVGSTALSRSLDPEEWRDVVRAFHDAAEASVSRFGGYVAQYLGDGVLAYFGYPKALGDDAERAVRAGLSVLDAIREVNIGLAARSLELSVRIGIHTGRVVVDESVGRPASAIFGETPNIASSQACSSPPVRKSTP